MGGVFHDGEKTHRVRRRGSYSQEEEHVFRHLVNQAPALAQCVGGDDDREWPEPQPLTDGLPPVDPFDYALLPGTLTPWAQDICERIQCAPDYVGVTIMAALGSVIGRKLGIRPQSRTDWTVTANQWALIVGRPGVLKSPAMEAALAPLKRLSAEAIAEHKEEMKGFEAKRLLFKLQQDSAAASVKAKLKKGMVSEETLLDELQGDEPELPALRRYIANDTTPAALGEIHRQNPNGLLVFRDEMVSLLKSLDREDNAEARGFYLTGWNGDSPYTFDRIMRGMNLHIPAVCLSLLGSTQPGRIAEYIRHAIRGGSGDDGLIQRFGLLVWPDNSGTWKDVDRWPDSDAKREATRVFDRLDRLKPEDVNASQDTGYNGEPEGMPYLRFDADAMGLFLEWRAGLETKLPGSDLHPAMESHLSKYRKLVPGLALILHLADNGVGPVSEQATLKALAWAEYLESHAIRAYASVTTPEATTAKAILRRIRKGDLPQSFSSRDVWRPGWAQLTDRGQVRDALRLLVDLDWLGETRGQTGGRPSTVYTVNPRGVAA
jgi:putative DNA primase/helicase